MPLKKFQPPQTFDIHAYLNLDLYNYVRGLAKENDRSLAGQMRDIVREHKRMKGADA